MQFARGIPFLFYTALGGQGCPIIKTDPRRYDIYFPPSRKMLSIPPGILPTPIGFLLQDESVRNCELQFEMEDILKWKWGRKFGGGGRGEIMKSSSAVSLERRILLEGEFKAFGKGKMVRWKAGFLSPRKGRKEERKGRVDVMYTWMVVSGLGRKKDSSCRSAALVLSTSEAADSQYLWTQTLTHSPGQN